MLFNSYEFIFVFLPIVWLLYYGLNKNKYTHAAKFILIFGSLFYYSWWNVVYLPLILGSMVFNYFIGNAVSVKKHHQKGDILRRRYLLYFGIICNLALLGYFKYADFFLENVNFVFNADIPLLHLALPLAISFFNFQQIAYLVDSFKGETEEYDFFNYTLFVSFFPQLIAGPIVHHKEMMPQFSDIRNKVKNYDNIAKGLFIFSIGLFKKVAVADTFAVWANNGFDIAETLNLFEAWATSLSYSLQLYFDFSGYTDMAVGLALLFNIKLPVNFNSPYKALNIQDFWRRWHMTLSRFLRDYVYIPLGGNKKGVLQTYVNLFLTFLVGGIWHGAGWTFVFWGFLHGTAVVSHRIFHKYGFKMNKILAWIITFNFVNATWVFFRAKEFSDGIKVLKGMIGMGGVAVPEILGSKLQFLSDFGVKMGGFAAAIQGGYLTPILILAGCLLVFFSKNSIEMKDGFKATWLSVLFAALLFAVGVLKLSGYSEFLYFRF